MKTIYKRIKLDGKWTKINLGKFDDFYLVGQRLSKSSNSDTARKEDVKRIKFEVGFSGFDKKHPLTINYLSLNFDQVSSSDVATNSTTALQKAVNYPSQFYIKPIEITLADGSVVTSGRTSIKVGVHPLRLN